MTNGQPLVKQFTVADSASQPGARHMVMSCTSAMFTMTLTLPYLLSCGHLVMLPISSSFPRPSLERHWFVFRAGMKRNGDLRNPQPQKLQLLLYTRPLAIGTDRLSTLLANPFIMAHESCHCPRHVYRLLRPVFRSILFLLDWHD